MKMLVEGIALSVLVYLVAQLLFSVYYFNRSSILLKKPYAGSFTLGNSNTTPFKILIDGDSVGAGVGASSFETSLAGKIAGFYSDKYSVELTNQSKSGSRMSDLVNKPLPSEKQNLVVLVISSNDLFHFTNLGKFAGAVPTVILRYNKIADKLIIIGPGRVFDAKAIPFFLKPVYKHFAAGYSNVILEEAKKYKNVVYINPTKYKTDTKYGDTNAPDGFHPNDEGYKFWFDMVRSKL